MSEGTKQVITFFIHSVEYLMDSLALFDLILFILIVNYSSRNAINTALQKTDLLFFFVNMQ